MKGFFQGAVSAFFLFTLLQPIEAQASCRQSDCGRGLYEKMNGLYQQGQIPVPNEVIGKWDLVYLVNYDPDRYISENIAVGGENHTFSLVVEQGQYPDIFSGKMTVRLTLNDFRRYEIDETKAEVASFSENGMENFYSKSVRYRGENQTCRIVRKNVSLVCRLANNSYPSNAIYLVFRPANSME